MSRPWLLLVLAIGCHAPTADGTTPTDTDTTPVVTDPCPTQGVVLADARDVERDAEGVSYSVFGEYPARTADWTRATGVLSLLKTVWGNTTTACTSLPAGVVSSIDSAIGTLDTTIPAHDQQASALAGNDVHIQMAPLFSYFNPDVPVEVVRMDAVFLRAGIHAHFGDWTAYAADLDSLKADWSVVKTPANGRVATCHRVAGTESVIGDLDETLSVMTTAGTGMDVATAEIQSDAGLLEVDIMELLFDCPPDGGAPSTGLGSVCATGTQCDAGQVCDLNNQGGRCAPDPATTNVGSSCVTTVDCGTYSRDACNNQVGDGYPGGYCVMEPCDDVQVCSPGATCVALPFETTACLKGCVADTDCRKDEGYVCQLFPTTPPLGFGPSDHACAFACAKDEDCTSPLTCNVASGKCTP